tara:strand:+ start:265 stop:1050 length:786 start_codon:yes stop_codon:yes gene_type:complete
MMTGSTLSSQEWLSWAHEILDQTDEVARSGFRSDELGIQVKADQSLVTLVDKNIERMILDSFHSLGQQMGVLAEESGESSELLSSKLVLDPLDGTANFIRGIPLFATLLALVDGDDVLMAMVSAPMMSDRWWAVKGQGAFYNGQSIRVSSESELANAQAFHGSLYGIENQSESQRFLKVLAQTQRQRGVGDYYTHMLVAMGAGEFAIDTGLKPWDMAPLGLIVQEAGGKVTSLSGKDHHWRDETIISSNSHIHQAVLEAMG